MDQILRLQSLDDTDDASETVTTYSTCSHGACSFANADGYEG